MNRWISFFLCAIFGLALWACGLQIPAHLRATDSALLESAGRNTPGVISEGLALTHDKKLGAAQLLLKAAEAQAIPARHQLDSAVNNLARDNPELQFWGNPEPRLQALFSPAPPTNGVTPITDFLVREENRARCLELLRVSSQPLALELLHFRSSTNTLIFSPSQSSAGQALDASISLCGLLLEHGRLNTNLQQVLFEAAFDANHKVNSQVLEPNLLDLMSLGQRFNWNQLVEFISRIDNSETLRLLVNLVRRTDTVQVKIAGTTTNAPSSLSPLPSPLSQGDGRLAVIFSAVELSGNPAGVANYLATFGQSGENDLGESLHYGAGAIEELLRRNQRLSHARPSPMPLIGVYSALHNPPFALTLKWLSYLAAGFFLAMALHFGRPAVSALERPLQVRGFHIAREILFALGFLLVVLLVSEPFLAQESQKVEFPFRLRLPTLGSAVPAKTTGASALFMNQKNLLILLLFFVLQALLYISSLVKLAEIRRQNVLPRIKLRLLENEEHLFDAGLYLGFAGTIISLILVSLNIVQQSLMAAYGSTSFGIIFVVIFKIFHLRPARRKLLLLAEAAPVEAAPQTVPAAARPLPAPL